MKKVILSALVLALSLIGFTSCQYENPALEGSENMIVKNFNVCNMLLGKTEAAVDKELKELGWTYRETENGWKEYTKKYDSVDAEIEVRFGSKSKACAFKIDFDPTATGSVLGEELLYTEALKAFGASCELSTKETPEFQLFVNANDIASKIDYTAACAEASTGEGKYEFYWAVPVISTEASTVEDQIEAAAITGFELDRELADYRAYSVEVTLASQKYK